MVSVKFEFDTGNGDIITSSSEGRSGDQKGGPSSANPSTRSGDGRPTSPATVVSTDRIDDEMSSSETLRIVRVACFALALPLSAALPGVVRAQQTADTDTSSTRSESLDSLQTKMSRSRWTRWMTDYIFLDRVHSDSAAALPFTVVEIESQYLPYRGRFIRRIDTARLPVQHRNAVPDWVLNVGNAMHVGTRERIIRKYLLMKEGAPLDPYVLADTERILRNTTFLEDATIVVISVARGPIP